MKYCRYPLFHQWQGESEAGSLIHFAFHADLSAVMLDDGFDDCKSQPVAFHFAVLAIAHAVKTVKNKRQVGGWDPETGILHVHLDVFLFHLCRKRDRAAFR